MQQLAKSWRSIFQSCLLRAFLCSPLVRPKRLSLNVRLAMWSKNMQIERSSLVSARMIFVTVLAIAWQRLFRSIGSRKSWATTHWIPLGSIFKERSTIYNRLLKQLRGPEKVNKKWKCHFGYFVAMLVSISHSCMD
jgi:hypothetical protein